MPKSDQFTELYEAAKNLLANAMDTGACIVDADVEPDIDDYPRDEDGDLWYHDWWNLKCAVDACDKLLEE